jgi:alpha-glucuronidase
MTWSNDPKVISTITNIMSDSWQACVNYMTPLGLHHLMAEGHHYGPGPDYVHPSRDDWSSTYYHKADAEGIGFDRSSTGTNAVSQYYSPLKEQWNSLQTCPDKYLLWFHHVPWDYRMKSGKTLWEEIQTRYNSGISGVEKMKIAWETLNGRIDDERFEHVHRRLVMQLINAEQWRNTCLEYFGEFVNKQNEK